MVKLTEDMIKARTRVNDMEQVKKLSCWGAELSDISVLRKLTNVEVLSLRWFENCGLFEVHKVYFSVNSIATLTDIQNCKRLQALYIRKNQISDLHEIWSLVDLPGLKNLWLEDNPCTQGESGM